MESARQSVIEEEKRNRKLTHTLLLLLPQLGGSKSLRLLDRDDLFEAFISTSSAGELN